GKFWRIFFFQGTFRFICGGKLPEPVFVHVQNLEKKTAERILVERSAHGPFFGLEDFIERTRVDTEQLNILIRAGALGFTGKNKKQLLWLANFQRKRMD